MSPSFFEHFFTSGTTKCVRFFLSFLCPTLESTSSPRSPSSAHCKKILRNHDLVSRWDRCYWGVIASKPSQRTKLYMPYVYEYIYILSHAHVHIYFYFNLCIYDSHEFILTSVSNLIPQGSL